MIQMIVGVISMVTVLSCLSEPVYRFLFAGACLDGALHAVEGTLLKLPDPLMRNAMLARDLLQSFRRFSEISFL